MINILGILAEQLYGTEGSLTEISEEKRGVNSETDVVTVVASTSSSTRGQLIEPHAYLLDS